MEGRMKTLVGYTDKCPDKVGTDLNWLNKLGCLSALGVNCI